MELPLLINEGDKVVNTVMKVHAAQASCAPCMASMPCTDTSLAPVTGLAVAGGTLVLDDTLSPAFFLPEMLHCQLCVTFMVHLTNR